MNSRNVARARNQWVEERRRSEAGHLRPRRQVVPDPRQRLDRGHEALEVRVLAEKCGVDQAGGREHLGRDNSPDSSPGERYSSRGRTLSFPCLERSVLVYID